MRSWKELAVIGGTLLLSSGLIVGCGSDDSGSGDASASASDTALVLYSGRSEELVGPLIERVGGTVPVKATYDRKAAQILEEGDRSPADLFFAQDAGELGALAEAACSPRSPRTSRMRYSSRTVPKQVDGFRPARVPVC